MNEVETLKAEIERLKKVHLQTCIDWQNDLDRLKAELRHAEENLHKAGVRLGVDAIQLGNRDRLIIELADALEKWCVPMRHPESKLIGRAREAVK